MGRLSRQLLAHLLSFFAMRVALPQILVGDLVWLPFTSSSERTFDIVFICTKEWIMAHPHCFGCSALLWGKQKEAIGKMVPLILKTEHCSCGTLQHNKMWKQNENELRVVRVNVGAWVGEQATIRTSLRSNLCFHWLDCRTKIKQYCSKPNLPTNKEDTW